VGIRELVCHQFQRGDQLKLRPEVNERSELVMAKIPKIKPLHCPTCKKLVKASDEDFPFCSDRCRRIDLGKWAMGVYKISSPVLDPELLEDLEGHERDR
jgi:endogenous inhibitor of DNA gyrase (YacG/DUF329 family)